jgi:hypothetical protein
MMLSCRKKTTMTRLLPHRSYLCAPVHSKSGTHQGGAPKVCVVQWSDHKRGMEFFVWAQGWFQVAITSCFIDIFYFWHEV